MSAFVKNNPVQLPCVLSLAVLMGLAGCASTPTSNGSQAVSRNITFKNGVPSHYQVKEGDTISKIAKRYDLNWREISAMNRLDSGHTIYIGQWLVLWQKQSVAKAEFNVPKPTTTTVSVPSKPAPAPAPTLKSSVTQSVGKPTATPIRTSQTANNSATTAIRQTPKATQAPQPAQSAQKQQAQTQTNLPSGVPLLMPAGTKNNQTQSPNIVLPNAPQTQTQKAVTPPPMPVAQPAPAPVVGTPTVKAIGQFRYPVGTQNKAVGQFGAIVNGKKSDGMFFAGHDGDVIVASQSGIVTFVDDKSATKAVTIQHDNGYTSSYIHLKNINVKKGQNVAVGAIVGSMQQQAGNLALFEFRMTKDGRFIDPVSVLK